MSQLAWENQNQKRKINTNGTIIVKNRKKIKSKKGLKKSKMKAKIIGTKKQHKLISKLIIEKTQFRRIEVALAHYGFTTVEKIIEKKEWSIDEANFFIECLNYGICKSLYNFKPEAEDDFKPVVIKRKKSL